MMASDFIIDVSEEDFEYQVLAYSQQVPVVVDFWAPWCAPCRVLGPMLENLAREGNGVFRLAKVDVDENQNLAKRYNVRGIPAVKAFRDGKLVAEFTGAQPEPKVREFLRVIAPGQVEILLEKGYSLLYQPQPRSAEKAFRQALVESPDLPQALLGLAKSLLIQGSSKEGLKIVESFPASREYLTAQNLRPLAMALAQVGKHDLRMEAGENLLEAAYQNSLRLMSRGNYEAAMDGLLDILRQDRRYRGGEARQVIVGILELLDPEAEVTRQYRNELAATLF